MKFGDFLTVNKPSCLSFCPAALNVYQSPAKNSPDQTGTIKTLRDGKTDTLLIWVIFISFVDRNKIKIYI